MPLPPTMLSHPEPVVPESGSSMMVEELLDAPMDDELTANAVVGTEPTVMTTAIRSASILLVRFGFFTMILFSSLLD